MGLFSYNLATAFTILILHMNEIRKITDTESVIYRGRGERTRTFDLRVPNAAR